MKRVFFISVLTSLVVGLGAGVVGGVYGKDVIAPWIQKNVAGARRAAPSPPPSTPAAAAAPSEDATVSSVERVAPAVVSVILSREITFNSTGPLVPFEDFFGDFGFRFDVPEPGGVRRERREIGAGTGFIITADGLVVTNRHVADVAEAEITVVLSDKRRFPARVLAKDQIIDLAILKIEAKDLPTVVLGDSDVIRIGETVIAIGNTLSQFPNTVTKGIISGLARRVVAGDGRGMSEVIEEAIQTDAAINPGNSGGPLINLRGEVIGVSVAVSRPAQGVGFAIPVNTAKQVIESVKATGRIVRPWLGVRYIIVSNGALVVRGDEPAELAVVPASPAEKAGIQENDIILELDGVKIDEEHTLARQISRHKPGDVVGIKILRQGNEINLTATLEELKDGVQ